MARVARRLDHDAREVGACGQKRRGGRLHARKHRGEEVLGGFSAAAGMVVAVRDFDGGVKKGRLPMPDSQSPAFTDTDYAARGLRQGAAGRLRARHVEAPTTAAVFEHPQHGVVLWDTGVAEEMADPERADDYWGAQVRAAFGAERVKRDDIVDRQLDKLGIKPKDVHYVVYSHLHLDHAGGMSMFPEAVHVVQRDEIRYALWPDPWTRPVYCQNDFKDIRNLNIFEVEGDYDLFDDGTLRLVKAPTRRTAGADRQSAQPGASAGRRHRPSARRLRGHDSDAVAASISTPWRPRGKHAVRSTRRTSAGS